MVEIKELERIKLALRVSHNKLDSELTSNIEAAKQEMGRVGVINFDTDLAKNCIEMFVKSVQNFEGEAERYQNRFDAMTSTLGMTGGYNEKQSL